jgi:hypothetical protein
MPSICSACRLPLLGLLWSFAAMGCSTLAESSEPAPQLPNAKLGPFRSLRQTELGNSRSAPYALRSEQQRSRDVAALDLDGDPNTLAVALYAAEQDSAQGDEQQPSSSRIVRYLASDARSPSRNGELVLRADRDWEKGVVAQPSVVRKGLTVLLYYGTAGGIALAEGEDGLPFEKRGLVMTPEQIGWDAGAVPQSPGVVLLDDGTFRMFYEAKGADGRRAIGEASSSDGRSWSRRMLPVLTASASREQLGLGGPFALLSTSALGRRLMHLYVHVVDADGKQTVALASRRGNEEPLQWAQGPVFGSAGQLAPTEPCVLRYPEFSLLFATARAGTTTALAYPAVAVGVAPAGVRLESSVAP